MAKEDEIKEDTKKKIEVWPLSAPVFFFFRLTRSIGKISSDRNYDITFRPTFFSSLSFVPLLRLSFGFFFICAQYR